MSKREFKVGFSEQGVRIVGAYPVSVNPRQFEDGSGVEIGFCEIEHFSCSGLAEWRAESPIIALDVCSMCLDCYLG